MHVRNQIEAARQLLGDADAAGRISEDDRAWLGETARQAATDLEQGREARAWAAVTNWRYWMLLHGEMDQSKQ